MRITEGQLRRIIREELIREQGMGMLGAVANTIYGDSKDTAASGLSAPQKVAYSAAKNFLDAGQMGARQVATGKVAFDPVTFWSLNEEQKRAVFDVLSKTGNAAAYSSIGLPPLAVVPVATSFVSAALKWSMGQKDAALHDALGGILIGLLATGKIAEYATNTIGVPAAKALGKNPRAMIRALGSGEYGTLMPELRFALAKLGGATEMEAGMAAGPTASYLTRGAAALIKSLITRVFGTIDTTISKIFTDSGRADLKAAIDSLKTLLYSKFDASFTGATTLVKALSSVEGIVTS